MENIQTQNQTQTPAVIPLQPIMQQPPAEPKSNNKIWIIILILTIVAVALAGTYIYLKRQSAVTTTEPNAPASISPTSVVSEEETELNSIDIGNVEPDLQDLQADVNKL